MDDEKDDEQDNFLEVPLSNDIINAEDDELLDEEDPEAIKEIIDPLEVDPLLLGHEEEEVLSADAIAEEEDEVDEPYDDKDDW